MSKKFELKPMSAAIGAALTASVLALPIANADENPFAMTDLSSGFMVAGEGEGSCGEGKCGEGEGSCGEGKCGEGKCGEGEGSCGEGKCGEGKCGES
ncbi:MAG: hypothetical protein AAGB35_06410 [Pseudomonadota bacterium]